MKSKRILSIIIAAVLLTAALWINVGVSATDDNANKKVKIEPKYTADIEQTEDSGGEKVYAPVKAANAMPVFNFDYELEPDATYALIFEYKRPRGTWWDTSLYIGIDTVYDKAGEDCDSEAALKHRLKDIISALDKTDVWTESSLIFKTDNLADENYKYLSIKGKTGGRSDLQMRGFEIIKVNDSGFTPTYKGDVNEKLGENGGFAYSVKKSEYANPTFNFNYELEPNTAYALIFEYKRPKGTWWDTSLYIGVDMVYDKAGEDCNSESALKHKFKDIINVLGSAEDWTEKSIIFETGNLVDENYKYLTVKGKTGGISDLELRNFGIKKVKKPELSPTYTADAEEYLGENDECVYGIKKSEYAIPTLTFNYILKANKSYKLTFEYRMPKGSWWAVPLYVGLETASDKFGESPNSETSVAHRLKDLSESTGVSKDWAEAIVTFSTDDIVDSSYKYLSIKGQTGGVVNLEMRNFSIVETDPIPDVLPYSTTQANWTNEAFRNRRYLASDGKNLINDSSLENDGGNLNPLFESKVMSITDSTAHDGLHSLMFNATGLGQKKWAQVTFTVEPLTEYYFTAWVKGEKWSNTNKNDMRFGFIDPATGKFLKNNRGKTDGNNIAAWDGEWHLMIISFMSSSADKMTLGFYGGNSVAYFDSIELFKAYDREMYRPYIYDLKAPADYSAVVEKSSCEDSDNILADYSFDNTDEAFWQSGESYGFTTEIVDTASTHGKALFYKENSGYTGYPIQTSYIKWIDGLKKNTEYTFSADYLITKMGNGYFGLIDGNAYYPRGMWQFSFGEEDFDSDYKWQKAVVKFNTNDYDRIGIIVCGKGGGAYIDNIRLFESSKGILPTADTFPNKLESSVYIVKDNMIGGVAAGTTVEQLISKFKNNEYIRAFDATGKEITDLSTAVGTGTQLRIMDGISVLDKADVIIAGDADGNGRCDIGDIGVLLKYLAKKAELNGLQIKALDVDRNGVVDVNDLALLSLHSTGIKKLSAAVL